MNFICRIWNDNSKRYGATFASCKKHYDMTADALKKNCYSGYLEKITETDIACEECHLRGPERKRKE